MLHYVVVADRTATRDAVLPSDGCEPQDGTRPSWAAFANSLPSSSAKVPSSTTITAAGEGVGEVVSGGLHPQPLADVGCPNMARGVVIVAIDVSHSPHIWVVVPRRDTFRQGSVSNRESLQLSPSAACFADLGSRKPASSRSGSTSRFRRASSPMKSA